MHRHEPHSASKYRCRSPFSRIGCASDKNSRLLVPIKGIGEVEAALAYLLTLEQDAAVDLAILHVTAPTDQISSAADPGYAEILLDKAESRCRGQAVAHASFILAGDLVFSILDAAELLDCDAILMPVLKNRPWHFFFPTKTVRKIQQSQCDVPLVLIDANGAVIRSMCA